MTKGKCKCFQQSHGNYCVSNPSVQYQGMLRASGNIGVYDVVTFNISADVEKCWEGTGNQATLDAGGYNGVFVNLSGSNLGPNAEPKTTTPILPLTGIALSDKLANNDSSQDRTRYSRQISYIFTGVEVDSATPHNQAYAIDWQLNAGSGSHETPSWWNPEDGKQVGIPPCSNYGRLTTIYEVPEGSSSGVKDTSIPLKTAGATNTNGVVVYEQSVVNQASYPDQPGKLSAFDMQNGGFGDVSLVFLDDATDSQILIVVDEGAGTSGVDVTSTGLELIVLDGNGDPYLAAPTYIRTLSGEITSGTSLTFNRLIMRVNPTPETISFQNDFGVLSSGWFEYEFLEDPLDLTIGSPTGIDTLRFSDIKGDGVTNTNINIVLEDGLGNKAEIKDFDTSYYGNSNTVVNNPPNIKVLDFRLDSFSNYTGIDASNIQKVTLNPYSNDENADLTIGSGIQFVPKGTPAPVLLDPQPTGVNSFGTGISRLDGFPSKMEAVLGGYFDSPNIGGLNEDDVIQLQFNQVVSDNLVSQVYENYWCENVSEGKTLSSTNRLVLSFGIRGQYGFGGPPYTAIYARCRIDAYDTLGADKYVKFGPVAGTISKVPPQILGGVYNFRDLFSVDVSASNVSGIAANGGAGTWGFTGASNQVLWQKEGGVNSVDGFFKSITPIDE